MIELKLSKRLKKIVDMCEPCDIIVDVGTDHGKVAIAIANKRISNKVIAIDNKIGPINSCRNNAKLYLSCSDVEFEVILSEGIQNVDKKRSTGIIITGIGYDNMIGIMSDINKFNYKYLILSPHTKITELIVYLDNIGIDVIEQENVFEDNKYYFIIKGKRRV